MSDVKMNSAAWSRQDSITVMDPDGWDRSHFRYSWYEELITHVEYVRRRNMSTCRFSPPSTLHKIGSLIDELECMYVSLNEDEENRFKDRMKRFNASFGVADVNHELQLKKWAEANIIP